VLCCVVFVLLHHYYLSVIILLPFLFLDVVFLWSCYFVVPIFCCCSCFVADGVVVFVDGLLKPFFVTVEKSILLELSNLSATAGNALLEKMGSLADMAEGRRKLISLATLMTRYNLQMSADDCGGLGEYFEFFTCLRDVCFCSFSIGSRWYCFLLTYNKCFCIPRYLQFETSVQSSAKKYKTCLLL